MNESTLDRFVRRTRELWGPLRSELVTACRDDLATLAVSPPEAPWLASLLDDAPASRELYRDPEHGFVLTAHTEQPGVHRAPHDHGRSWVVYAVARGAIQMSTYSRFDGPRGVELVLRDETLMVAGEARVFLPGDIHDTRCTAGPALLLRFAERDLRHEDAVERRMTRYVARGGVWTVGP